jgi:hypothetical protein
MRTRRVETAAYTPWSKSNRSASRARFRTHVLLNMLGIAGELHDRVGCDDEGSRLCREHVELCEVGDRLLGICHPILELLGARTEKHILWCVELSVGKQLGVQPRTIDIDHQSLERNVDIAG